MPDNRFTAYMYASSSKGNCAVVKSGDDSLLIDAGISAKRITNAMEQTEIPLQSLRAIFITHEHTDHIAGLEVLCHKVCVPVYVPKQCAREIARICPSADLYPLLQGEEISVGDMLVRPYRTPHDSCGSLGYRITFPDGSSLGYGTDIGYITRDVISIFDGCSCVVLESNHDEVMLENGSYPESIKQRISGAGGHLANQSIVKMLPYLVKNGAKRIVLAHLSQENNTPDTAYKSACAAITACGFSVSPDGSGDVSLSVALPTEIVKIY